MAYDKKQLKTLIKEDPLSPYLFYFSCWNFSNPYEKEP